MYSEGNNNANAPEEGNEPKIPLVKSAFLAFVLIIILVFVLIFVRGCTVSKNIEQKEPQKVVEDVDLVEDTKVNEKEEKSDENDSISSESPENSSENSSSEVGKEGEILTTEQGEIGTEIVETPSVVVNEETSTIYEVRDVVLGSLNEKDVMVANKKIYRTEGVSYAYCVGLIFPSSDGYVIVDYFCPKKTYDALVAGDTVTVKFQLDSNGIVAITSISK